MSKKVSLFLLLLVWVAVFALLFANPAGAETKKLYKARLATSWPKTHPSGESCSRFAAAVKEATNGRLEITVYHAGTLFGSKDWVEGVSGGGVEFGASFGMTAERFYPDLSSIAIPYTFKEYGDIIKFFSDNELGKDVMEGFQNQLNVKLMYIEPCGHLTIWTSKEIKSLDELKGLKARTLGPSLASLLSAMGMSPITMPSEEVYQALQSGMINAYISNIVGPRKFSYTDFSKVVIEPSWGVLSGMVLANGDFWKTLPKDIQKSVLKAASYAEREAIARLDASEAKVLKEFTEKLGGRIYTMTDQELDYMKRISVEKVGPSIAKSWKDERLWREIKKRLSKVE